MPLLQLKLSKESPGRFGSQVGLFLEGPRKLERIEPTTQLQPLRRNRLSVRGERSA